jgi:hypothetical protein
MKTQSAEEILNDVSTDTTTKGRVRFNDAIKAMSEYSSLQNKELIEENERLRKDYNTAFNSQAEAYANEINSLTSQRDKYLEGLKKLSPSDEELAVELVARYIGNSRGNPISKKAFIDAVSWMKSKIQSLITESEK